ncbi:FYVE zinc finger domain-containing protein [Phytophthora infestans]|uniref:FYVE zinc finger domain-containing protein n=1 Tax=Phytophthora infestans TaxID=4787 RepID=A0A833THD6_PHYIN|nr:FYVE zinc finger domain-containing protein [Phytophthora infestans]KAF4147987.1 FYVE zinc finger domain-containing protein [Phytophthora infestans]
MADSLPLSFPALYSCAQSARSGPKVMPGVSLSAWRKDEHVLRCGICAKKFGLLRWKHHCRACGDVCCRRCLGFCLVDVPEHGVDLAYTCARCVQKHTKPTLVGDINWPFAGDVQSSRLHLSRSADSLATMAMSDASTASPCSFSWSITPTASPPQHTREFDVVVSQYRNQKLHSVCSLLVDYLECVGGAIVLVQDLHLWVIAHKGLHPRVLHDPTFLSICSRALSTQTAFTVPDPASISSETSLCDPSTFQFFGASPLFDVRETAGPALGCIVALDTRARTAAAASKMEVTLENLADHVMDLLAQDETILRIYASGDFKIFASAATDTHVLSGSFDGFSSTSSTAASGSLFSSMHTRPRRSSSFASGDEYFSRKGDNAACRKLVDAAFPGLKKQQKRAGLGNSRSVSTLKAA